MKFVTYVIISLFMIPTYAFSSSKPAPPPELTKLFEHISEIEEAFEDGDLSEATSHFKMANGELNKLDSNLKKHVHRIDRKIFITKFKSLDDNIRSRNSEFIEQALIDVQKTFFVIAEYYQFNPPLFLQTVGEYIEEAKEGLEKNDFDEVRSEMEEVIELIEYFEKSLLKHGISNDTIEAFTILAFRIKRASKANDSEAAEEGLNKLKTMHKKFIKAY